MERLTEKTIGCFGYSLKDGSDSEIGYFKNYDCFYSHKMVVKRLGEYEDLEEQGLLLKLPLTKEDAFWEINRGTTPPSYYKRYAHSYQHCVYVLERLGKTCFLTEAEAEKALAEMEKQGWRKEFIIQKK